jgi:micrococcal nuclease
MAAILGGCAPAGGGAAPTASAARTKVPPVPSAGLPVPSAGLPVPTDPVEALGPTGRTESGRIVRVVDGDTVIVRVEGRDLRVRYIGMDTPESVKPDSPVEAFGREASAANEALVAGRDVVLERDVSETDQYGRALRDVWIRDDVGWTLVGLRLVRLGYARVSTFPPDVKYADRLLAAERAARDEGRGLWGAP